jgi:hypothetical protein
MPRAFKVPAATLGLRPLSSLSPLQGCAKPMQCPKMQVENINATEAQRQETRTFLKVTCLGSGGGRVQSLLHHLENFITVHPRYGQGLKPRAKPQLSLGPCLPVTSLPLSNFFFHWCWDENPGPCTC